MIQGERVNLRAADRPDATLLHRWLNAPEVMAGWGVPDQTISSTEVQRRLEGWLAEEAMLGRPVALIVETLTAEPVGLVLLSQVGSDARGAELSLLIGESSRWGEGLGTDALQTVLGACFDAWNLHRVALRCEVSNERARRLYTRCGFVQEGVLREASFTGGVYEDQILFAMLVSEWRRPDVSTAPSLPPASPG